MKTMKYCTGNIFSKGTDKQPEPIICLKRTQCRCYLEHCKLPNNAESKKEYLYINAADCMERGNILQVTAEDKQTHTPTL